MPPELTTMLTAAGPVGVFLILIIRGDLRLNRELQDKEKRIEDLEKRNETLFNLLTRNQDVAGRAVNKIVDASGKEVSSS